MTVYILSLSTRLPLLVQTKRRSIDEEFIDKEPLLCIYVYAFSISYKRHELVSTNNNNIIIIAHERVLGCLIKNNNVK